MIAFLIAAVVCACCWRIIASPVGAILGGLMVFFLILNMIAG